MTVLALVDHEPSDTLSPGVGRLKHPQRSRGRLDRGTGQAERSVRVEDSAITTDQPGERMLMIDRCRDQVLDRVRKLERPGSKRSTFR